MFELLMNLPLFRGVSRSRIAEVVGSAKFHFLKYPKGETVVRAGEECTHLAFVISGSVRSEISNSSKRFSVSQTLKAPSAIAPDFLFGRTTRYPGTVVALTDCSILKISKVDYIRILNADQVFMFNFLNTLSVNAQKALDGILALTSGGLDERIAFWIIALTQPGSEDIELTCKTRDLCNLFSVQRNVFDAACHEMEQRNLIRYSPRKIEIVDRREMLSLLERQSETQEDVPGQLKVENE
ncbi:Crp/Fnr family transcriptional regulator [Xylanibacter rodentium]|uniref:Crp/Fnr family transcriptional regulator n=1 Tax=Xylanibacter rodentium TaxID=2736289 RepID=UPI0025894D91|nr:Crp/Fnr family transcriptional regulator [Xylanibacter rodentium]